MKTILIIEDDSVIAEVQKDYLEASGYAVEIAASGELGLQKALDGEIDLILLDLMLPGVDGYEICKQVRRTKNIPILMVSAKKEEIDKIRGLGLGADDYISKPFSVGELVARVKAHLSRFERLTMQSPGAAPQPKDELRLNELTIDKLARKVFVREREAQLTTKEYDLLLYMVSNPNRVFRKDELFERIWGFDAMGDNATVTVHISKLREKIERQPSKPVMIETIWGVGYRFNV
ncbi:response regulator transcription factor [Paenibacillus methanolicus]|uniref:DNA-binding response OmpR family regulator n=1 Tax=Paenibacillus methanolicus TaxID=582686 RepID=A0A5S5CHA6_9BACL|nr:response regulator transcription factor [Paenibacillus methanolicus]TYP79179.1 DNA-binding response OmpR family regulator [Paenibacillus methanolicus]